MEQIFSFQKQLRVGNDGENLFLKYYKKSTKGDGLVHDIFLGNGDSVELKTDTYTPALNFFFERYGNDKKMISSGPWKSKVDGIKWFIYLFKNEKKFYWFEPAILCKFLNKYIKNLEPKKVYNKNYYTIGYIVPRWECDHLAARIDKFK